MSNLFKLHVYLKQPKDKQSSLYPVYMRLTMDGKSVEISTKKEVDPNKWNKKAGKLDENSEKVREFNGFLDRLISKIYAYQNEILQNNLPLSP